MDWARSLIPLVDLGMVRVEGQCLYSPPYLHLMDNILLNIKSAVHPYTKLSIYRGGMNPCMNMF